MCPSFVGLQMKTNGNAAPPPPFFMHAGCPPASNTQSGLTTGKGAFIAS